MKIKFLLVLLIVFSVVLFAQKNEETEPAEQDITANLKFKDINVFEYDLDLLFETMEGETMWFNSFDIDLSEYELYTIIDHDGFPEYIVNEAKIGQLYEVKYVETEVEGEFSGEMEPVLIITGLRELEMPEEEVEE
jgi:hypothetical protein